MFLRIILGTVLAIALLIYVLMALCREWSDHEA